MDETSVLSKYQTETLEFLTILKHELQRTMVNSGGRDYSIWELYQGCEIDSGKLGDIEEVNEALVRFERNLKPMVTSSHGELTFKEKIMKFKAQV